MITDSDTLKVLVEYRLLLLQKFKSLKAEFDKDNMSEQTYAKVVHKFEIVSAKLERLDNVINHYERKVWGKYAR